MSISKYLLCLFGILLALPILALIALAFSLPVSISGIGYLSASLLSVSGLIMAPWMPKRHTLLTFAGLTVLIFIIILRIFLGKQNANIRMIMLPQGKETRWVSYVIDEQDSLIFGEALFHYIGGVSSTEHEGITRALYVDYSGMRAAQGVIPSPIVATYLNMQQPDSFDAVIIEPQKNLHPDIAVVFLHGFMGNVTAQCWEVSQAVSRFGALTVCPSTGWQGEWWQPEGEAILRSTFRYLREQGIQKFYLGGFSNGGFGISRLVPKLGNEDGLSGLIFIDGISNGASIAKMGFPVLIIQGTQDERMPAGEARRIAEVIGDTGTYVELNSDHFLIMKQPNAVQDALANWLEEQVQNP